MILHSVHPTGSSVPTLAFPVRASVPPTVRSRAGAGLTGQRTLHRPAHSGRPVRIPALGSQRPAGIPESPEPRRHRKASRTDRKCAPARPPPPTPCSSSREELSPPPTCSPASGGEQLPHGSGASEPRHAPRQPRLSGVRGHRAAAARAPGRARSQDSAKFLGRRVRRPRRAPPAGRREQCSAESVPLKGCDCDALILKL